MLFSLDQESRFNVELILLNNFVLTLVDMTGQ
jgi:hypothetical protein